MLLTLEHVGTLMRLVADAQQDPISCDQCFSRLSEFTENLFSDEDLFEDEISIGMQAIQRHLEQCGCCRTEHEVLLEALSQPRHHDRFWLPRK